MALLVGFTLYSKLLLLDVPPRRFAGNIQELNHLGPNDISCTEYEDNLNC